jgi:hypothetical protein
MHNSWTGRSSTSTLRLSTVRLAAATLMTLAVASCTPHDRSNGTGQSTNHVRTHTHDNTGPGGGGAGLVRQPY